MAAQIHKKIDSKDASAPLIPGKIPENSGHSMPGMAPDASPDCVKCGLCAT